MHLVDHDGNEPAPLPASNRHFLTTELPISLATKPYYSTRAGSAGRHLAVWWREEKSRSIKHEVAK